MESPFFWSGRLVPFGDLRASELCVAKHYSQGDLYDDATIDETRHHFERAFAFGGSE